MTPVSIEEQDHEQHEQVELDLSEAADAAAGGSQADLPQAVPEQTYDSLFPALPMGSTKPARPAVTNNATPAMVKVTSSRITQVRITIHDEWGRECTGLIQFNGPGMSRGLANRR